MSSQCKYKQYIWELPVRWCHWSNALAIVVLAGTGFFIGHPVSFGQSPSDYTMGWIRFVHFVAGYVLLISVLSRMIWSLIGNCYAGWREYFPFMTTEGRRNMKNVFGYYTFMHNEAPETVGHNPMAATAYVGVFCLYWILLLTGFAMFTEYNPTGVAHWLFTPMYTLMSTQTMRLVHHGAMWLLFGFMINHIYSAWLMDIKERGGEISSMFSGFKFTIHKYVHCETQAWQLHLDEKKHPPGHIEKPSE